MKTRVSNLIKRSAFLKLSNSLFIVCVFIFACKSDSKLDISEQTAKENGVLKEFQIVRKYSDSISAKGNCIVGFIDDGNVVGTKLVFINHSNFRTKLDLSRSQPIRIKGDTISFYLLYYSLINKCTCFEGDSTYYLGRVDFDRKNKQIVEFRTVNEND